MSISPRTVIVTGATKGIGRGLAIGLAESGAHVIATGRTQCGPESLEATQQECVKVGGTCETFVVDHGNDDSVRHFFETLHGRRIDVLVNNAYAAVGMLLQNSKKPFWERAVEGDMKADPGRVWDIVNGVGLRGNYICSVYAMRMMKEQGGVIVNITSWGGFTTLFDVAYGVGKQAVDRLSAEIANDAPSTVKSIAFCPGYVATQSMLEAAKQSESLAADEETLPDWNMETPFFVGRVLAALLQNEEMLSDMNGKVVVGAEAADYLNVNDENGFRPLSYRSLRFNLMFHVPFMKNSLLRLVIPRRMQAPWWILRSKIAAIQYWN